MDVINMDVIKMDVINMDVIKMGIKKAPQQGIEPWFSDLESDVLTIERLRIRYSFIKFKTFN